jgi:phosphoglycolate phosphatase-like HAD superfamily hydrolase
MKDEEGRMKKERGLYDMNGGCPKNAQSFQVTENSSSSFILHPSSFPKTLHPSSLRILLWDIDGTLTRSTRVDSYKDYTAPVLEAVFGTAGRLPEMKVSGMTDLQIIAEALRDEGFTHESIRERAAELHKRYMVEMERVHGNGQQLFEVLPGVREVLQAAAEHPRYLSALLTGNIEPAAQLKMRLAGLSQYFQLPGAYGDDSYDRRDLPALAAARINKHLGANLEPHQFIVIGDTPNDIACARHFGARVVAVATGRMYSPEDLRALKPDALLPDLSDTELVMRTLGAL